MRMDFIMQDYADADSRSGARTDAYRGNVAVGVCEVVEKWIYINLRIKRI